MKASLSNLISQAVNRPASPTRLVGSTGHIFSKLTNLEGITDINEVAIKAGFDFTAVKRPQFWFEDDNGMMGAENFTTVHEYQELFAKLRVNPEMVSISNRDANGSYLGTTGINYGVAQFKDVLAFTQHLVDEGEANYIHGGVTHGGARAFLVMKTAEFIEITPGDRVECYFYVSTAHNGKSSLSLIPAPLRLLNNTVLLVPGISVMKFKHSKHVNFHITQATKTIGKIRQYFDEFRDSFDKLATTALTDHIENTYLKLLYPDGKEKATRAENVRDKIKDIRRTEKSLQLPSVKNTLLGAYFAVCQYNDHYTNIRKTNGRDELSARIESRMSVNGTVAKKKAEALAFAFKLNSI